MFWMKIKGIFLWQHNSMKWAPWKTRIPKKWLHRNICCTYRSKTYFKTAQVARLQWINKGSKVMIWWRVIRLISHDMTYLNRYNWWEYLIWFWTFKIPFKKSDSHCPLLFSYVLNPNYKVFYNSVMATLASVYW